MSQWRQTPRFWGAASVESDAMGLVCDGASVLGAQRMFCGQASRIIALLIFNAFSKAALASIRHARREPPNRNDCAALGEEIRVHADVVRRFCIARDGLKVCVN